MTSFIFARRSERPSALLLVSAGASNQLPARNNPVHVHELIRQADPESPPDKTRSEPNSHCESSRNRESAACLCWHRRLRHRCGAKRRRWQVPASSYLKDRRFRVQPRKLSGSTLNRQNPEQRFYSRQHGESFEERNWPADRQANRVRAAHRYADDRFKRPVIFGDDQGPKPNRDAGPARTGRSFAQFPGTERADRKPVRTSSRDGANEMG